MKKAELIFIPSPGAGHLVSAVEFSKRLIARDPRLSITLLTMNSPFATGPSPSPHEPTPEPTTVGLRFIPLPPVKPPPPYIPEKSIEEFVTTYASSYNHHVIDAVTGMQKSVHVAGIVLDMFCTSLIDVAHQLSLPSYVFFTSGAAFLGLVLDLPDRYDQFGATMFDESNPETTIPCFQNPVPSWALPSFAFNSGCMAFMNHGRRFKETKGIISNTFSELEPFALNSLSDKGKTVPVYSVGPVLDLEGLVHGPCNLDQGTRIMKWLDEQPESSVVFLCFGSFGFFKEDQVRELAVGLSRCGQRFLWSIRKPPADAVTKPTEYTDLELRSILPGDFWKLVEEGRGMVCGWAPQVEILAHKSTGAFVSHCGWNSILESLWFGKPIVPWPLYAEQHTNAFVLVNELKLATMVLGCGGKSNGLVIADEVERAVRSVMDKDNPVRSRVREMAEMSRQALKNGGSSFNSVGCLIERIMGEEV